MSAIVGSRWWKFDFHTHTPFSTDTPWHNLPEPDSLSASDWLRKCMEAGIDCVAITYHNGAGWIDKLAAEYRQLKDSQAFEKRYKRITLRGSNEGNGNV